MTAVFLSLLTAAAAAQSQGESAEPPAVDSSPQQLPNLPPVTVRTPAELEHRVGRFIWKATSDTWQGDESVPLWHGPICPLVAGRPRKEGQFVFDHLSDILTSVGAGMGQTGCRPNFFVIFTAQPEALLNTAWERNDRLFGDQGGAHEFIDTPRPVRIWYNAELVGADGRASSSAAAAAMFGNGGSSVPVIKIAPIGRSEFGVVQQITSIIAVVDIRRVVGLDLRQLTDYVAMAGLTKVALDGDYRDAPTILRLFTASGEDRPTSLSPWDEAFLKELYRTDQKSKNQRQDVARGMIADLSP